MSAVQCIGALDQGTQSTRFFLFDLAAKCVASHQVEFQQHRPRAGWVEHEPQDLVDTARECMAGALARAEQRLGRPPEVLAVGLTNQRETALAWDRATGRPLHRALVWLDTRTAPLCARVRAEQLWASNPQGGGDADFLRPVTGLPVNPYFSAYKWRWLAENAPGVREAWGPRCALGTVDSWLLYHLTGGAQGGVHVTDLSNASRTGLMDLASGTWHEPTLRLFGIEAAQLPRICSNAEVYGRIAEGPCKGVPIAGCLGDQQAAMLGHRCRPGEAKNTYGTGCFVLLNTGERVIPSKRGLLSTVAYQLGPQCAPCYALEGSIATAGAAVSWLRDNLKLLESADEIEALASSVRSSAGVFFVPAFGGLLAPHWRDDARGALLGLTSYSSRAHVARALLDALAWQTREVVDAMLAERGQERLAVLRVDGGASRNDLLMQLQADALQTTVRRPAFQESSALGAALAAGIGSGIWSVEHVLEGGLEASDCRDFEPQCTPERTARQFAKWQVAIKHCLELDQLDSDGEEE